MDPPNSITPCKEMKPTSQVQAKNITTIFLRYETNDRGELQNSPNSIMNRQLIGSPALIEKLNLLRQSLSRMHLPFLAEERQISADIKEEHIGQSKMKPS
jgi:hypothetical protein